MSDTRPSRTDDALGHVFVLVVLVAGVVAYCTVRDKTAKPEPQPQRAPVPTPDVFEVRAPEPPPETETERIARLKETFRNRFAPGSERTKAIEGLAALPAARDEAIKMILDELDPTLKTGECGDRRTGSGTDASAEIDLPAALAAHGRAGLTAFLKRYPERRIGKCSDTSNKLDVRFTSVLDTLIHKLPADVVLLDVLLEHPDRLRMLDHYTRALDSPQPAVNDALLRAARHQDPAVRLRILLSQFDPNRTTADRFDSRFPLKFRPQDKKTALALARERLKDDPDEYNRAQAIYLLAKFGDEAREGLPELCAALRDPVRRVRLAACWAVGVRVAQDQDAVAPVLLELAELLRTPEATPKMWSAILAQVRLPNGFSLAEAYINERKRAASAAMLLFTFDAAHREKARNLVSGVARDPRSLGRHRLLLQMFPGEFPGALAFVMRGLDARPDAGDEDLARRLADHFPKEAVAAAEERMAHADPRVRWLAFDLLARSDPERARKLAPVLAPLLLAPQKPGTGELTDPYEFGFGVEPAPHPLPAVDWARADELRPTEVALPWLATAARAGAIPALPVLAKLGPKLKPALPELVAWRPPEKAVGSYREMLIAAGPAAAPSVIAQMTRDSATDHDFVLLPVLAKLAPTVPEARTALEKWVRDTYGDSRTLATISGSALGTDPAFAPVWVDRFRGSRSEQQTARDYFAKQGADAAPFVPVLAKLLKEMSAEKSPPDGALASVVETLGRIGSGAKSAVPDLTVLFARADPIRAAAIQACARIGGAGVPDLVKALSHADRLVRAGAAEVLGRIGPAARELALTELLRRKASEKDAEVLTWIKRALERIAPEDG